MIQKVYNRLIRPHLSYKYAELNGVKTKAVRTLDRTKELPEYNASLVEIIDDTVSDTMSVAICGDLYGVQTVHAAKSVGSDGSVVVFEGSGRNVWRIRDAVQVNNLKASINVEHAIIGEISNLFDAESNIMESQFESFQKEDISSDPKKIEPADLPTTDVLILNISGSEIFAVDHLDRMPRLIVVQTYEEALPGFTTAIECLLSEDYTTEVRYDKWVVGRKDNCTDADQNPK
jgi:hypothetical protein